MQEVTEIVIFGVSISVHCESLSMYFLPYLQLPIADADIKRHTDPWFEKNPPPHGIHFQNGNSLITVIDSKHQLCWTYNLTSRQVVSSPEMLHKPIWPDIHAGSFTFGSQDLLSLWYSFSYKDLSCINTDTVVSCFLCFSNSKEDQWGSPPLKEDNASDEIVIFYDIRKVDQESKESFY